MLKDLIVRFDTTLTAYVQHWPAWLQTPMLVITNIGQPLVMGLVGVIIIALAMRETHYRLAYSMGATIIAMGANGLLKHYIHRPRPDTLYVSNMYFQTSSFPSGHAFGVTVVCGLLAYLSLKYIAAPLSYWTASGLAVFILLVGISRIYLGAHFPTDVIAGWLLGAVAVALIVIAVKP